MGLCKEILKYSRRKEHFISNYNKEDFRKSLVRNGYDIEIIIEPKRNDVLLFKRVGDKDWNYLASYYFSQLYLSKSVKEQYKEHKKYKTLVNVYLHYLNEMVK